MPRMCFHFVIWVTILASVTLHAAEPSAEVKTRLEELKRKLRNNPADQESRRELLATYVVELDDPVSARSYSREVDDVVWRECVALASRDMNDLSQAELLRAAKWYRALGGRAAKWYRALEIGRASCRERV